MSRSSIRARTTSACRRSATRRSTARSTSAAAGPAERAFLPDDVDGVARSAPAARHLRGRAPVGELRRDRVLGRLRARARRAVRLPRAGRHARCSPTSATPRHPLVVAGGPLTFSNPLPLGAVRRRGASSARPRSWSPELLARRRRRARPRARCSTRSRALPGFWVPVDPRRARCRRSRRPTTRCCPRARRCSRRTPSCARCSSSSRSAAARAAAPTA